MVNDFYEILLFIFEKLCVYITDNWLPRVIPSFLKSDSGCSGETCLLLSLILVMVIRMFIYSKRAKERDEKIMMKLIDRKLQMLHTSMVEASNKINDDVHEILRKEMHQLNKKYSNTLSRIADSLESQRTKSEEKEARSCHLILKYRSARLLQYGQINAYLKSLVVRLRKETADLSLIHSNLSHMKDFADGFGTKISETKIKSQQCMKEILHILQSNALYENDQKICSKQLLCLQSTLETILQRDRATKNIDKLLSSNHENEDSTRNEESTSPVDKTNDMSPKSFLARNHIDPRKRTKEICDSQDLQVLKSRKVKNITELYHTARIRTSSDSGDED